MKNLLIFGLSIACLILMLLLHVTIDYRVKNLERQLIRIEQGYNKVLAENEKLVRLNNQTLQLMAEGGWNDLVSMGTGN